MKRNDQHYRLWHTVALYALACLAVLVCCGCEGKDARQDAPEAPAGFIAYVNGQAIAYEDFLKQFNAEMAREERAAEDPLSLLNRKIASLNRMVDRILIEHEMQKLGIEVSEKEVQEAVSAIQADYPQETFEKMLADRGSSYEKWRKVVAGSVLERKLMNQVIGPLVEVSEDDMAEYFRTHEADFERKLQVRASQILVATKAEADSVKKRLAEGADFAVLAQEVSLAPERDKGGDLGYFGPGQMPTEFDEVVFKLPVGKLSGVVKTPYGFHVFLVTDREEPKKYTFEEAKPEIRDILVKQRLDETYRQWIAGLRERSQISVNESLLGR